MDKMNITLIQTGGTIDKDYPKSINGWAFEIGAPAYLRIIEKLPKTFKWELKPLMQKDSTEIDDLDRERIKEACQETKNSMIIITHGTDTLIKTAESLSQLKNKTIVLTGAMLPERFSNSDAELNFGMALAGVQSLPYGIYISIQGILAPYNQIDRNLTTGEYFKK